MPTPNASDPRCPVCGEPIGATATYCMHCSADLTEQRAQADTDQDGYWDEPTPPDTPSGGTIRSQVDGIWHPDGVVDNTLSTIVGIVGGLVIGGVSTVVLILLTSSEWALVFGGVGWLAATVYLVTRKTVLDTLARTAYGIAIAVLLVPLIAFGHSSGETDLATRVVIFLLMLGGMVIPAAIAAAIGVGISRYAQDSESDE